MRFIQITSEDEIIDVIDRVFDTTVALDCESTDKNPRKAEIISVVISLDGKTAYSIPAKYLPLLARLANARKLILQNFKYDYQLLFLHGLDLSNTPFTDIMLLHHLIDETKDHDLDSMVKEHFNDPYKEVFWKKHKTFESAPSDEALEYECKDAIYTYRLHDIYTRILNNRVYLVDHVHNLAKALYYTEITGVRVNLDLMLKTKGEMGGRIATYLPKLRQEHDEACNLWELNKWLTELDKRKTAKGKAGVPKPQFNFGSNTQMQWLLYEYYNMPVLKKTEAKLPSTDYETIEKLSVDYPILQTYKDYIDIKTIYGTFVEGLLERVEERKIYPSFNINGTVTGRISHSNPNMGNMPKDGPYRNFFLPDNESVIIGADYSQLEVVIEANLTGDTNLARIVNEGVSKHDITAEGLKIGRDLAKTLNFAMGYHCGPKKVQKLLKCSFEEAQYQWNKYWELYKGCRDLKMLTDAEVDANLPITNLFGRIRHLSVSNGLPEWQIDGMKRQAYNFKIQGPGADFTNRSFYLFSQWLRENDFGRALWSVHDEVVASVKPKYYEQCKSKLTTIMVSMGNEYKLKIPLSSKAYGPLDCWSKA